MTNAVGAHLAVHPALTPKLCQPYDRLPTTTHPGWGDRAPGLGVARALDAPLPCPGKTRCQWRIFLPPIPDIFRDLRTGSHLAPVLAVPRRRHRENLFLRTRSSNSIPISRHRCRRRRCNGTGIITAEIINNNSSRDQYLKTFLPWIVISVIGVMMIDHRVDRRDLLPAIGN